MNENSKNNIDLFGSDVAIKSCCTQWVVKKVSMDGKKAKNRLVNGAKNR
jgi:hypothetical protein